MMNIYRYYLTGWLRYVDFHGRSSIAECWTFLLINKFINIILIGILFCIVYFGLMQLFISAYDGSHYRFEYVEVAQLPMIEWLIAISSLAGLFNLIAFMPTLAAICRRLNDSRTSKWSLLWILFFPIGVFVLIVLLLKQSRN